MRVLAWRLSFIGRGCAAAAAAPAAAAVCLLRKFTMLRRLLQPPRSRRPTQSPPNRKANFELLTAQFPDVEPAIVMAVLEACENDEEMATERLFEMMGTNDLPPIKECVICLDQPRETRFSCGHACCCFDCANYLLGAANAVCPTCRSPVSTITSGPNADGVPIARQPTFEAQVHDASPGGPPPLSRAPSWSRGWRARLHVWLTTQRNVRLSPEAWRCMHRLVGYGLVPACALTLYVAVHPRAHPTSTESMPPSPPTYPPFPPELEVDDELRSSESFLSAFASILRWLARRSFDAMATAFGAICSAIWNGISIRTNQSNAFETFVTGLCAMLTLAFLAIGLFIGGFIASAMLSFAVAVLSSLLPQDSMLRPMGHELVLACCFFLGWQLMLAWAHSSPDIYVVRGVRYGRGVQDRVGSAVYDGLASRMPTGLL